ncbi:hypothetical protein MYU51_019821 [Penicillium brevicompactum]
MHATLDNDGGGVRGLSTLFILKSIMDGLNKIRTPGSPRVKPCDVFDLIGGTSTGGIIAIMLGRLEMDVDECIKAYVKLTERVFKEKKHWIPLGYNFDINFVCATVQATAGITQLRSYELRDRSNISATICEAALATSAATSFFDPVSIGPYTFVDGAFGANNPVEYVEEEASSIWCPETELKPLVKTFISIGTGVPSTQGIDGNALKIHATLASIVTETERTEQKFIRRWAGHFNQHRYFRFNVQQGLQTVGLEEYEQQELIRSVTEGYIAHSDCTSRRKKCVENLVQKQEKTPLNFAKIQADYVEELYKRIPFNHNIPFQANERFVDRENEISQLEELLFSESPCYRVAITGLGGIGKTQIALQLAHRTYREREGYAVFWIQATSIESVQKSYAEIARKLKLPGWDDENSDVKTLLKDYLNTRAGKWLLIFDNADDYPMWDTNSTGKAESDRSSDFLPQSEHGRILFTTRFKQVAKCLAKRVIEVHELDEKSAKDLLCQHLNPSLLKNENEIVFLLRQLAFLPLAIVQAASFIEANELSCISEYRKLLDRPEQEVIDLLSTDFEADGRYNGLKNPVVTTWLVSFEHICKKPSSLAAQYLSFAACVEPKDIPISLLPPAKTPMDKTSAIGTLKSFSFVTQDITNNSLTIHRLVHLATRNWLRQHKSPSKMSLTSSYKSALETMHIDFPCDEPENRQKWRAYMPHALHLLQADETQGMTDRYRMLARVGGCLHKDGRIKEAVSCLEELVEWRKHNYDQTHPMRLSAEHQLAGLYKVDGQNEKALKLFQHVVGVEKRILTKDDHDFLVAQQGLASAYKANGQLESALRLQQHVVKVREEILAEDHWARLASQHALANIYHANKQIPRALQLLVHVVMVKSKSLAENHPSRLASEHQLALLYHADEQSDRAFKLLQHVVSERKKLFSQEHPSLLASQHSLAIVYFNQEQTDQALKLMQHVVAVRQRVLSESHPSRKKSEGILESFNDLIKDGHTCGTRLQPLSDMDIGDESS